MKTQLNCIPCFFQQVVDSAQLLGLSEKETKEITDKLGIYLNSFALKNPPPFASVFIQEQLVKYSGKEDPYYDIKRFSNEEALKIVDQLRQILEQSKTPLKTAVELACAGNIIDFGVSNHHIDISGEINAILEQMEESVNREDSSLFQLKELDLALKNSKRLMYLGDNAGEIVFDRLLLETIKKLYPHLTIYFATRGKPVVNDVLIEDALFCKIDEIATVVSSEVPTPGLALEYASKEFLELYKTFDVVISKGQGNYECLSETDGPLFYLLITKCNVIAKELQSEIRQLVLLKSRIGKFD